MRRVTGRVCWAIVLIVWGSYTVVKGPLLVNLRVEKGPQVAGDIFGMPVTVSWSDGPITKGDLDLLAVARQAREFLTSPGGRTSVQVGSTCGVLAIFAGIGTLWAVDAARAFIMLYGVAASAFWVWWVWRTPTFPLLKRFAEALSGHEAPAVVVNAPWLVTLGILAMNVGLIIFFSRPRASVEEEGSSGR